MAFEYTVVPTTRHKRKEDFEAQCSELLNQGYAPQGGVAIHNSGAFIFAQAFVRER